MEYYFPIKSNEILVCATMWVNIKNPMLSEIRQSPKTTYCMVPSIKKMPKIVDRDRKIS